MSDESENAGRSFGGGGISGIWTENPSSFLFEIEQSIGTEFKEREQGSGTAVGGGSG